MKMKKPGLKMIKQLFERVLFPILGAGSLIWFLMRVIPKPSRASYPCMRVSFPIASSFIIWCIGFFSSWTALHMARQWGKKRKYMLTGICIVIFLAGGLVSLIQSSSRLSAKMMANEDFIPNDPVGEARGIYPGRVVWVHNPDATNENCTMSLLVDGVIDEKDDVYFLPKNNNSDVILQMVKEALMQTTGAETQAAAWDSLFKFFNRKVHHENKGYSPDQKIFIKTNNQGVGKSRTMYSDLRQEDYLVFGQYPPHMTATSPYTTLAILDQLVNVAGVPQENIFVGDPIMNFNNIYFDIFSSQFPNVHYLGKNENDVTDCESYGRTRTAPYEKDVVFYSDRGSVLTQSSDKLSQQMVDADYLINIAALKGHIRAGISLFCKSHFGSHMRTSAAHLHNGLVAPDKNPNNSGYGQYRVFVDIMGHEHLGGKTMLYLLDALWGGKSHELCDPRKWDMAPFNGDYTSSIFMSLDPVAIESVGYDFLRTEYNVEDWGTEAYPNIEGVDDYLHQAADSANWPEDIQYDPENDGTLLGSLGVHEHWNNAADMQYSRDLGIGDGIELVKVMQNTSPVELSEPAAQRVHFELLDNYPNPFNNGTMISYTLESAGKVTLAVYDVTGQKVRTLVQENQGAGSHLIQWDGRDQNANTVPSGMYVYRISVKNETNSLVSESKRMLMVK